MRDAAETPENPRRLARFALLAAGALLALSACGGGGGGWHPRSVLAPPPALPPWVASDPTGAVSCDGVAIGARTVGDLEVPAGRVCVLQGTRVGGSVRLNPGSVLDARDVVVSGSVLADRSASVVLAGDSIVNASVRLVGVDRVALVGTRIDGLLVLQAGRGLAVAEGNRVGGDLQLQSNLGGAILADNRINGRLQCGGNQPLPTGAGNQASALEGQCAGLDASGAPALPEPVNPPVAPVWPAEVVRFAEVLLAPDGNVVCSNARLGAQSYANVAVPAGAGCELRGTRLSGSLDLGVGASADVQGARIAGSIQADGATHLLVSRTDVSGNVQAERGGVVTISDASVAGAIQLRSNRALAWLQDLRVSGIVQLLDNLGGASLHRNAILGILTCQRNQPAPTGTATTATLVEDQCRAL